MLREAGLQEARGSVGQDVLNKSQRYPHFIQAWAASESCPGIA